MTTKPGYRLSLIAFPQRWDGTSITLRVLIMPQGDPRAPLLTGLAPVPDSPAFADARPKLVAKLIGSTATLPAPADMSAQVALGTSSPTAARPLFEQLAGQFDIAADPPGMTPRRGGYRTRKYLPNSYRSAFNFDRPRTPFCLTDDTYSCMMKQLPVKTPQPPPPSTVSWGRVIGFALRQPLLAQALGLVWEGTFAVPDPDFYKDGGWLYVDFDPAGDFGPQVSANLMLLQSYAARIPPLAAPRPLFAAVLFPVLATPPSGSYDGAFTEAETYDDGFVKIVHGAQPELASLIPDSASGLAPSGDFGLQLGWDDEQVTIWYNRQIDAAEIDAPFGVSGYRIDVKRHGDTGWHSLCRVTGALALGATPLGTFQGELSVETLPVRHDPAQAGEWWLPGYFTYWRGGSVVLPDPVARQLHGAPAVAQPYTAVDAQAVPLRYGRSYDLRVRMVDLSRGGPEVTDNPFNLGPAPTATIPFRRMVPFKAVSIPDLDLGATSAAPQTSYRVHRPLLNYPAAVYADVPNAATALLADLPNASAAGREAAVPDPNAVRLAIEVQVRQLSGDTAIFVTDQDQAPYSMLYSTTRAFPSDPSQPLTLRVRFEDVPDIWVFPAQPASGPLVLPRAREIRLVVRADAEPDPMLLYWGSHDAMQGQAIEILTGADGVDERALFAPDVDVHRIRGILLQPDPVPTSNLAAMLEVIGESGTATSDVAARLARALSLSINGLTYTGFPGQRIVFGCSAALRHMLSPEHGALTFSAKSELCQHWLVGITLRIARDWSWSTLGRMQFEVRNRTGDLVGVAEMSDAISAAALTNPDRSGTTLVFFDAVDYKPAQGTFPSELDLLYTVTPVFPAAPSKLDPPLGLPLRLPIAAKPVQTPRLASAGLALSSYIRAPDYSATEPRRRALWLEFEEPVLDPEDAYFGRVLAYAPDQLLTGAPFDEPADVTPPPDPPLSVDPELIRVIVPGQSDDRAGLNAMEPLLPSESPLHFMLPLPPGFAADAPELFGMFVYEFRVGHHKRWSTAQGRFGPPLRVSGVQHPAPALLPTVSGLATGIRVAAPHAMPVFQGRNLLPAQPLTQLWALLYAQVMQADGSTRRNVLLHRRRLERNDEWLKPSVATQELVGAAWSRGEVEMILQPLALPPNAPLSIVVVETYSNIAGMSDPMGGDLGQVRILRNSPLLMVPPIC